MVWWSQLEKPFAKVNFNYKRPRPCKRVTATSELEYNCIDHLNTPPNQMRFTSIMTSVAPVVDRTALADLVLAGTNIVRVSLASASRANHLYCLRNVRAAERACSGSAGCCWPVGLAVELKGSTVCTGLLDASVKESTIPLEVGDTILLTSSQEFTNKCSADLLYLDCPHICATLQPGMKVIIDRGEVVLGCLKETPPYYLCRVDKKGNLGSLREVSIPGLKLNFSNLTSKDAADISFALENEVDIIIVPFVRNGETPSAVKQKIKDNMKHGLVMSKICNNEGLQNIDSIVESSDGIILSQDNLALELPTQDLWKAMNCTIAKCNQEGTPVFFATSKLCPEPPSAMSALSVAADVSRVVLAGASGLVLEGGELGGAGPGAEEAGLAAELCRQAEPVSWINRDFWMLVDCKPLRESVHSSTCYGAVLMARMCGAACILVASSSSKPARWLARLRPACPVLAVVGNKSVARRLHLYRGVVPLVYPVAAQEEWRAEVELRVRFALAWGAGRGWLRAGAPLVLVSEHALRSPPGDLVRVVFVPAAGHVPEGARPPRPHTASY